MRGLRCVCLLGLCCVLACTSRHWSHGRTGGSDGAAGRASTTAGAGRGNQAAAAPQADAAARDAAQPDAATSPDAGPEAGCALPAGECFTGLRLGTGGGRLHVADVDGDRSPDLIAAPWAGGGTFVAANTR